MTDKEMNLASCTKIAQNIKLAKTNIIKSLHELLFEDEFQDQPPRGNRARIRQFSGFTFQLGDETYKTKLVYILNHFTVAQLVSISNILLVDFDENKEEMAKRILCRLMNIHDKDDQDDNDDDDEDESEDDDEAAKESDSHKDDEEDEMAIERGSQKDDSDDVQTNPEREKNKKASQRTDGTRNYSHTNSSYNFALTFRDVADTVRTFSGDDGFRVENWFEDLEETASLMNWTELHKLIFAKKSLTGLAKLFIRGERNLTTFKKFKTAMLSEFGKKINSAQLHRALANRRMKKEENAKEYYLLMREISSQGLIEDEAFMQYVIDGISNDLGNKVVLYGAKNLSEFKEKIDTFQKINEKSIKRRDSANEPGKSSDAKTKPPLRCYNCGETGHRSSNCRRKSQGTKCFYCNEFGHVASKCPKKQNSNQQEAPDKKSKPGNSVQIISQCTEHDMNKPITINGVMITAFIDTGSDLNLIRLANYLDLGAPHFERTITKLAGFGKCSVDTIGRFNANIEVDNIKFCTDIFIVPDDAMDMPLIIGKPTLKQITITVNAKSLKIIKSDDYVESILESTTQQETELQVEMEETTPEIYRINVKNDQINVGVFEYTDTVNKIIEDYKPVGNCSTNVRMKLVLADDEPVSQPPRRLAIGEKREVNKKITQWLDEGIIRESSSDYASPIVLVKKKTGDIRICVDYRRLNAKIVKDRYPLPIIEDQLDKLADSKIFSTLDLKNGFFHVPMDEQSIKYTSFVTPEGQFEFLKAPFGLCNSPAVFQRFINNVFKDYIRDDFVLTYMDDLVVPAVNCIEAVDRLRLVLKRAESNGLKINWSKCQFLSTRIEYLGHEVENGSIRPSPRKIEAVMKYPLPKNIKQIQSFLGLTGYFRKFIKDYALKARPLSDMLKKNTGFKFEENEEMSFKLLKESLCNEPVLKIFSFGKETELHTDASKEGYGAILMQRDDVDGQFHPVYYMSRKTSDAEKKYDSYELEVLAIIESLKKFRVYLLGIKFKIITDCLAFTMTMKKKDLATRVARWALLLEEFDYEVKHRPGASMKHCDALSRCPIVMTIRSALTEKIRIAQRADEHLVVIMEVLKSRPFEDFIMKNDILYKSTSAGDLLVIPSDLQDDIIKRAHENGHFSVRKVKGLIEQEYYISKLENKIHRIIANCVQCIVAERKTGRQEGFLNPIPKGDVPLDTFHIDHLGPLSATSKNYKHVLVIVDAFSKFVWIYPTKTTNTQEVLQKLDDVRYLFGNPKTIVTDKGSAFTSNDFQEYCKEHDIHLSHITTGVPRGNGQVERINRCIIPVLTKLSVEKPEHWFKHVRRLQQALNSTTNRSIGTSPFQVMFGVPMRRTEEIRLKEVIEEEFIHQFMEDRKDLRDEAKKQIKKIQEENRKVYNRRRTAPRSYEPGDLVAIKRTQYAACSKLLPKYLGPYQVVRKMGPERYEVRKLGNHVGPRKTESSADLMKPWSTSFEANDFQDGRVVGRIPDLPSTPKTGRP